MRPAKEAGIAAMLLAAGACAPVGGYGTTIRYECQPPRTLKVDFQGDRAFVSVDNGRPITLRQEPSASGFSYAGNGYRLRGKGDEAIWTGLTREAPYQCRQVVVPR